MKYFSNHSLLPFDSWKYWYLNDRKQPLEPHFLLIIIEELSEEPSGSLTDLLEKFNELLINYQYLYEDIFLEKVSFHRGCGDYEYKWYIVGKRLENNDEYQKRIAFIEQEEKQKKEHELAQQKIEAEKEYKKFLKLKSKFEPKG